MTAPQRIQLSRAKGWRMPANTVKVTRGPGMKWGNPFVVGCRYPWADEDGNIVREAKDTQPISAALAVEMFEGQFDTFFDASDLAELRGKNLACWCKLGSPCHGDLLLKLANAPSPSRPPTSFTVSG